MMFSDGGVLVGVSIFDLVPDMTTFKAEYKWNVRQTHIQTYGNKLKLTLEDVS